MSACAVEGKWQETLSLLATSISERLAVDIISLSLTASALLGEGPGTPKASMSWVIEEMLRRRRVAEGGGAGGCDAERTEGKRRDEEGRRLRRGPLASAAFLRHLVTLASTSACLWLRRVMRSSARGSSCVFRANRAKAKPDVLRQLRAQGWHVVAAPFHADAFHATFDHSTDTATLGVTLPHLTGEVYFQELSSMLPAAVLQAVLPADSLVLDLCAAPGSKSTQLAQFLARGTHGTLVANELDPFRAGKLRANLLRVGLTNFVVTTMDGRAYGDLLPNTFDGVLVDAPCSCEGNARKDIFALLLAGERDWSLEEKQMELALSGWNVLKSGGYLVYSTCTLNRWENEGVCERLVRLGGCERVPVEKVLGMPSVDASGRLWPQELDAEGFFVACFRKTAPVHGVTAPRRAPEPFRLRGAVLLAPEEAQRLEQRAVEVMGFWPGEKETMDGERTLEVVDGCG
ncbi:Ribosomal RNA small subunit methyltransferase F (16S rRNA m5C1407 methyltransferase) (rRNA (cytosine-C(5)-)-methyltransferase RsmF) [Durusdinium trenchii]|uniref:Ribosomal RNA small subunit methyltransferase F (16S rRNA m5C1407 methyltransferase) (rRNA (cytosine-C(5)-)-methyltransferase RsmF) n=1 Tax=Durusdinium trenchii TaxID=1381693 RepID=A0ABP0S3T9_9DINO